MAKNIEQKFSIDLGGVVENSIMAVKAIRRSEQARKESEFQRAIANGLSYDEQIKMREKQLIDEKSSYLSDDDYIFSLEKSITDTKKLNRFTKYRTKYTETFTDLVSGRINEQRYLDVLKAQLTGIIDSDLTLEIQKNITSAEEGLKAYNDTILSNKVKLAKYDGSVQTLASMVSQITIARTNALINNNEDEVTAYDETLASLNSQLSSVKIEDAMLDFQAKSETRGTNALEKLEFMNEQIRSADPNSPIRIADGSGGAKTYSSAQAFWTTTRDNYLSSSFFKELEININNNVAANTKAAGIPQVVIDNVVKTFNDLKSKPELAPFLPQLEANQNIVTNDLVGKFANRWIEASGITGDFAQASAQIAAAGTRYGVDVVSFVENLSGKAASLVEGGEEKVVAEQPAFQAETIEPKPIETTTPTTPVTSTQPVNTRVVRQGDTLSGIASEAGIDLNKLIELNPQFTDRPDVIRPGETVNLQKTGQTPTPATPTPIAPTPQKPIIQTITPPSTTTPPVTPPVTPTTPTQYTGTSIVDFLKLQNKDSSFASRAKLAVEKGITN